LYGGRISTHDSTALKHLLKGDATTRDIHNETRMGSRQHISSLLKILEYRGLVSRNGKRRIGSHDVYVWKITATGKHKIGEI